MTEATQKRTWLWAGASLGILAAGIGGVMIMGALRPEATVEPPQQTTLIVQSNPVAWRSGSITVAGSGRVQAFEQVELQSQVSGDITYVSSSLQAGAHFTKGERLVTVNSATLAARRAEFDAQLASAKADLDLAETQAERSRKLLELRAASQEEVDQRNAAVAAAIARVAQLEASVRSVNIDLSRASITAPFDGRVLSETISIGDVVAPGNPFATLYSTEVFEIPIALAENDAALINGLFDEGELDIPAEVKAIYGGAEFTWNGHVHRVEPGIDETSRTIDLVIRVREPETRGVPVEPTNVEAPPLLLGMFASVEVPSRDLGSFVELPRGSLRPDNTIWYVVADQDGAGTVEVADVSVIKTAGGIAFGKLSIQRQDNVHVLAGVSGRIVPGSKVRVSTPQASEDNSNIALRSEGETPR